LSYDEVTAGEIAVDESLMNLQQLEDRVKDFTTVLRGLKEENSSMKIEYGELQGKIEGYEEKVRQIKELEAGRVSLQEENNALKEKISVIEERIKTILSRLEDSPDQE